MVDFAYAVGRLRAIEAKMLDANHLFRMVDAISFEAAFLILADTLYAEKIEKLEHAFDFTTLLKNELADTRQLLLDLAPSNELIEIVFKKYDDELDDQAYLSELKNLTTYQPNHLFNKYARAYLLLNEIRLLLLNLSPNLDQLVNKYRYSDYAAVVVRGIEEYQKSGSLHVLEREIDDHLLQLVKKAKYQVMGLEPLLGFAIAKECEIKNLRLVLTGKLMQLEPEVIRERLRKTYV